MGTVFHSLGWAEGKKKALFFTDSYDPINCPQWKRRPPLCHPDRSVAEWRDLQFSRTLLEMFVDRIVAEWRN
jgi:hypothetical protein